MLSLVPPLGSATPATTGSGWLSPLLPPCSLVSDALSLQGSDCQAAACGILFTSTLHDADRGRPGRPAASGRGTRHTRPGLRQTPHGREQPRTDAPVRHVPRTCAAAAPDVSCP